MRGGVSWVIIAIASGLLLVGSLDIYFDIRGWRSVGDRLQGWARRYPFYSGGIIFVLGALAAHFFLNNT